MRKITLLIVEDEPIIAADLQDRLQAMGYAVSNTVSSGERALEVLQNHRPDLVLMDIQLQGELDGIQTAAKISASYDLPIIYLTSNSDTATFAEAKMTKPAAFLSKPFRGRDLQHAIELAVANFAQSEASPSVESEETLFWLKDRLFIKQKDKMVRLFFQDILWLEADDYYCKIHTEEKPFLVTMTLKKLMEQLEHVPELVRIHRSYAINILHLESMSDWYVYVGSAKIAIGKSYRPQLLSRLKML